jgi:hypothetical protein
VAFIAPSKRYLDEVLHMKQSVFKGVMSSRKKFNDMIQMRTSYRVQQLWFCKRSIIDNKLYPVPVNFSRTWLKIAYGKVKKSIDSTDDRGNLKM